MAQFKLNEGDQEFLKTPRDAVVVSAGMTGTESWIERDHDCVVRIGVSAVARATDAEVALQVCIEADGNVARGQDGPLGLESVLQASQSVQILVKAGERVAFKAYPAPTGAQVLRTVVWAADVKSPGEARPAAEARAPNDRG